MLWVASIIDSRAFVAFDFRAPIIALFAGGFFCIFVRQPDLTMF